MWAFLVIHLCNKMTDVQTEGDFQPENKMNASKGFPWQLSIQPVSRGWIGLGTERAEVILLSAKLMKSISQKTKKLQTSESEPTPESWEPRLIPHRSA